MPYLRLSDMAYPLSQAQVRADFPNTSFPDGPFATPEGYVVPLEMPLPAYDPITQRLVEGAPALNVQSKYERVWTVEPLDPVIVAANQAAAAAAAAAAAEETARESAAGTLKGDATVNFLRTHTPAEVEAYIQTNVTDLASARTVLKKLGMIVALLARERLGIS